MHQLEGKIVGIVKMFSSLLISAGLTYSVGVSYGIVPPEYMPETLIGADNYKQITKFFGHDPDASSNVANNEPSTPQTAEQAAEARNKAANASPFSGNPIEKAKQAVKDYQESLDRQKATLDNL